jgi:hypothetical protein
MSVVTRLASMSAGEHSNICCADSLDSTTRQVASHIRIASRVGVARLGDDVANAGAQGFDDGGVLQSHR